MQNSPLTWLIALMALTFTVGSFWWLHARRGRLKAYSVVTFSGLINPSGIRLHLPIVLYNSGAAPRVVRAMRLRALGADGSVFHLVCQTFNKTLDVNNESFEDFAHAFVVPGRSVVTKYAKFTAALPSITPGASLSFVLQVRLDESEHWQGIKTLDVHIGLMLGSYNTWSNDQSHWLPSTLEDGRNYQRTLTKDREDVPTPMRSNSPMH